MKDEIVVWEGVATLAVTPTGETKDGRPKGRVLDFAPVGKCALKARMGSVVFGDIPVKTGKAACLAKVRKMDNGDTKVEILAVEGDWADVSLAECTATFQATGTTKAWATSKSAPAEAGALD